MVDNIIYFVTRVPDRGFELIGSGKGRSLHAGAGVYSFRKPLDENPTLFRQFGNIAPDDEDEILKFADSWGWLGVDHERRKHRKEYVFAEPLHSWRRHIATMRRMLRLRDQIEQGIKKFDFVTWPSKERIFVSIEDDYGSDSVNIDVSNSPAKKQFMYGDTFEPALHYLMMKTNRVTSKHLGTRLMWDKSQLVTQLTPHNLLGAIYWQFSRSVGRKLKHRQCEHCGTWFEYQRATARYCSKACRTYASINRNAK